jgi:hypothetical protein
MIVIFLVIFTPRENIVYGLIYNFCYINRLYVYIKTIRGLYKKHINISLKNINVKICDDWINTIRICDS